MKTAGYIVIRNTRPLLLCKDQVTPRGGVLLKHDAGLFTFFPNYKRAWRAIRRTVTWTAVTSLFPAKRHEYEIRRAID